MTFAEPHTMLDDVERDENTVLTVGFFDGIHRGHQSVLTRVSDIASRQAARALMVTFDRPPRSVLLGNRVPLLTTLEEKVGIVHAMGLSGTVVIPFNPTFAELDPAQFVDSILIKRIGLSTIVLGYDHRFGKGGTGNVDTMKALGQVYGFDVEIVPEQRGSASTYSSTRIRELLLIDGDVAAAARQLGRYYILTGEVVHGDGRGKTIGFPTANMRLVNEEKAVPAIGVYAVFVKVDSEPTWRAGIMNIGFRPTVTDASQQVVEVHLLDFAGDLYTKTLRVAFVQRIREERRFDGVDALVSQIAKDVTRCKSILKSVSLPD